MQKLNTLFVGDYFFFFAECENNIEYVHLEISRYKEIDSLGYVNTETIYHWDSDRSDSSFYSPELTLVGKLIPDNSLSRIMYTDYVKCKEVKGYLIDKKFYKIKKEIDTKC